jgi:hypothetical protein
MRADRRQTAFNAWFGARATVQRGGLARDDYRERPNQIGKSRAVGQRRIDLVIKGAIEEADLRIRIADLKAERQRFQGEPAASRRERG